VIDAEGWENRYFDQQWQMRALPRRTRDDANARPPATGGARDPVDLQGHALPDLPLKLTMVERHPFGSQAFMPLSPRPFLVDRCARRADGPGEPQAFLTSPGQGVNYPKSLARRADAHRPAQDFLVVDRAGLRKILRNIISPTHTRCACQVVMSPIWMTALHSARNRAAASARRGP
jgi:hypothetical protein